jgi:hypothetical protein
VRNIWTIPLLVAAIAASGTACHPPQVNPGNGGAGGQARGGGGGAGGGGPAPARDGGASDRPGFFDPSDAPAAEVVPPGLGVDNETCAAESHRAEAVGLDLMLLIDVSSSMADVVPPGNRTKYQMARDAVLAFTRDPKSAGIGVGLQFFPLGKSCTSAADCGFDGRCQPQRACAGPNRPAGGLQPCGADYPACPGGTTCVPLGRCSGSSANCTAIGQPCPGGAAGDTCAALPGACAAFDFDGDSCQATDYRNPAVVIGALPEPAAPIAAVLGALRPEERIGTPIGPAVTGALAYLRAHVAATPGRRGALIFTADGEINICEPGTIEGVAQVLSAARAAAPSLTTYVIGVFPPAEQAFVVPDLNRLATAGGGGMPFVLDPMGDLTQKLLDALGKIRGAALPCEYLIPRPRTGDTIDFQKVNVGFTAASGAETIPYVASAPRCDPMRGGWYYDVDPAVPGNIPTRVVICPATCTRFKAETAGAKVDLLFGCKRKEIE